MTSLQKFDNKVDFLLNALTLYLPICLLFYMLARIIGTFSLEVPYGDALSELPRIKKMFDGTLTFHDLLQQKGDHRSPFFRFLMYSMARISHWNMIWDSWVTYAFAIGSFFVFVYRIHIVKPHLGRFFYIMTIVWMALLVTSPIHGRLWVISEGGGFAWCSFFALLGFSLTCSFRFNGARLAIVFLCGVISFYSFLIGLAYWPTILLFIFLTEKLTRSEKIKYGIYWVLMSVFAIAFYFYDYDFRYNPRSLFENFIDSPYVFFRFILLYTGNVLHTMSERLCQKESPFMVISGIIGFILSLGYFLWWRRQNTKLKENNIFFLLLIIYTYLGGVITAVGRAYSRELLFPLYDRLIIFTQPLWIALFVFIGLCMKKILDSNRGPKTYIVFALVIIFQFVSIWDVQTSSIKGLQRIKTRKNFYFQYVSNYENMTDADFLKGVDRGARGARYRVGLPILKEYKLANYREQRT